LLKKTNEIILYYIIIKGINYEDQSRSKIKLNYEDQIIGGFGRN